MRPIYISTKEVIEEINYAPLALFHIPRLTRKSYVETDNDVFMPKGILQREKSPSVLMVFISVWQVKMVMKRFWNWRGPRVHEKCWIFKSRDKIATNKDT